MSTQKQVVDVFHSGRKLLPSWVVEPWDWMSHVATSRRMLCIAKWKQSSISLPALLHSAPQQTVFQRRGKPRPSKRDRTTPLNSLPIPYSHHRSPKICPKFPGASNRPEALEHGTFINPLFLLGESTKSNNNDALSRSADQIERMQYPPNN